MHSSSRKFVTPAMSATQQAVSQMVIKYRLKHGECIHCGIQTHTIKKKLFSANEKIPISNPGKVDNGRCLNDQCQEAGNNVMLDTNDSKPSRISGQTVGVVAAGTGAVLTVMGIPGGEVLMSVGQAVVESSHSGTDDFSNSGTSSHVNNYHQGWQQQQQQQQAFQQWQALGPERHIMKFSYVDKYE